MLGLQLRQASCHSPVKSPPFGGVFNLNSHSGSCTISRETDKAKVPSFLIMPSLLQSTLSVHSYREMNALLCINDGSVVMNLLRSFWKPLYWPKGRFKALSAQMVCPSLC